LPPRRYDIAAGLFAEAMASPDPAKALNKVARTFGQSLGTQTLNRVGKRLSTRRLLESVAATLHDFGYEPSVTRGELTLRNCPFDALCQEYRDIICPMNRAVMDGLVKALMAPDLITVPESPVDRCCVTIRTRKHGPRNKQ
jgi:predicted ArsR family transcriptional regulator